MSLARKARERALARKAAVEHATAAFCAPTKTAPAPHPAATPAATPEQRASAQMQLRMRHDLRRLKEIKSIERKIAAKRTMLPEYAAWVRGLLDADTVGSGADDVLATVMVWEIDVGDYSGALDIAEFVLRHGIALPARYARDAAALVVEEIATAALKEQAASRRFDRAVLDRVDALTADMDMHDEIRAKLVKAIGVELAADVEDLCTDGDTPDAGHADALSTAIATLRRAQSLHDRVGVKDRLRRLERIEKQNQPPG